MRWQLCWKCRQRGPFCRRFVHRQNIWAEMTKSKLNTNGWGLVTRGGVENWLAFAVSNKLLVKWHLWIWNPSWFRTKKGSKTRQQRRKRKLSCRHHHPRIVLTTTSVKILLLFADTRAKMKAALFLVLSSVPILLVKMEFPWEAT